VKLRVGLGVMVGAGDNVGPEVAIVGTDGAMVEVGWAAVGAKELVGTGVSRVGATEGSCEFVGERVGGVDGGFTDGANDGGGLGYDVPGDGCGVGTKVPVVFSPLVSTRLPCMYV